MKRQSCEKKFGKKSIDDEARRQINVPSHLKPRSSSDLTATAYMAQCAILVVVFADRQINQLLNVAAGLTP